MKKIVSMIIIGTMILQTLSIIGCSVIGEEIEAIHREKLNNIVTGEIIVKFKPEYSENKVAKFFSDHGVSVHHRSRSSSFHLLKVPENKYSEIINIFNKVDKVNDQEVLKISSETYPNAIFVSALKKIRIEKINFVLNMIFKNHSSSI